MNALHFFIITALTGFCMACAGVWMLAGPAWALLAGALSMFCVAVFIRRGLVSE